MSSSLIDAVRTHLAADVDPPAIDDAGQADLLQVLAAVPDTRYRRGVRYRLASLQRRRCARCWQGRVRSRRSPTGPPIWTRRPVAGSAAGRAPDAPQLPLLVKVLAGHLRGYAALDRVGGVRGRIAMGVRSVGVEPDLRGEGLDHPTHIAGPRGCPDR